MPSLKLQAIERTIEVLEAGLEEHSWHRPNRCNCGLLARSLVRVVRDMPGIASRDTLASLDFPVWANNETWIEGQLYSPECLVYLYQGTWSQRALVCEATGYPVSEIMRLLIESGFTYEEIKNLEDLSDPTILDGNLERTYVKHITQYLKNWALKLAREELAVAVVAAVTAKPAVPVPVKASTSVPVSVRGV